MFNNEKYSSITTANIDRNSAPNSSRPAVGSFYFVQDQRMNKKKAHD